jgi:dihydrofolate synthase/folylpolyglutamate synthase
MQLQTLDQWLAWLEQAHPREIDLGLDRIRPVAKRLGLLSPQARVVTVAGTNGKGSCVAAVAALATAASLRVGVYTSPHLLRYNERISVCGKPASDQQICAAFSRIRTAAQDTSLTYFEYGTLAALDIFKEAGLDLLVLEVGMGGRLDAVNLVDADISVVTSIDLDHQDWLGNTRDAIALEKVGIARSGCPLVCADPQPPSSLLAKASELQAIGYFMGQDFGWSQEKNSWHWRGKTSAAQPRSLNAMPLPWLPLPSLAAAIQVASLLQLPLTDEQIGSALQQLQLPGRFQQLEYQGRNLILDVAHNPAAGRYLAERLKAFPVKGRPRALVAMMADKDRQETLSSLVPLMDSWYLVSLPVPRAASVQQLAEDLAALGAPLVGQGSLAECLASAVAETAPGDTLVIWGSFYTVAAALEQVLPLEKQL